MAYEFKLPDLGEGIAEVEVVTWHVKVGENVKAHDALLDVETDKALVEVPSPVSGVLTEQRAHPGDVIQVGSILAVIDDEKGAMEKAGEDQPPSVTASKRASMPEIPDDIPVTGGRRRPPSSAPTTKVVHESVGVVGQLEEAPEEEGDTAVAQAKAMSSASPLHRVEILPRDRMLARDLGIDPDMIRGSGRGGRVTEEDVRRAAKMGQPPPAPQAGEAAEAGHDEHGLVERIKVVGMRRTIAESMVRSLATAAQVTTTEEADVTRLADIRNRERDAAAEEGIHLTYLPFIMKALVGALKRDPQVNSSFDNETDELIIKSYYNFGVATETPNGLIVPVVRNAEHLSILELGKEIERLSTRARKRELTVGELKGSTFTISNYGAIGGIFATPILNPGETGLLGIGRIREKPVVLDSALAVRKVMPLSFTFDHRAIDGATAQHFLKNVVRRLEDPDLLLLGA